MKQKSTGTFFKVYINQRPHHTSWGHSAAEVATHLVKSKAFTQGELATMRIVELQG